MKNFFLPTVIVITALLYWFWPTPENEIIQPTAHADSAKIPPVPIPVPAPATASKQQLPGQQPASQQPANPANEEKLKQCWKTIQQQISEQKIIPPEKKQKSPRYVRFANTLAKAGLLNDSNIKQNPDQALRRLARMSRRDPQNSAPLIFSAAIEMKRGNTLKAEQFLAKARTQTTKFDSYLKSYSRSVLSQVSTPAELIKAFETLSKVKTPDYSAIQSMLTEMNQPELARQLMSDGLDEQKVMDGVDWVPLEYGVGRAVLQAQGDSNSYPTYQDLMKQKQNANTVSAESVQNHLQDHCDLQSLAPVIEQLKAELRNRKR